MADGAAEAAAVHSHAHEEDVPGTVNLSLQAGDVEAAFGQAFYPVPSDDPNDPLLWSNSKKISILVVCASFSFLGNAAILGPSVYISVLSESFEVSPSRASDLINYCNLVFGFGSMLLVPAYMKFGRRPVMLGTLILFMVALIGCAKSTSFHELLAWRIVQGFASGVCEALPVQLINDIFFLHERGSRLGFYTFALCFGSTAPLYAGYMLNGGLSWRLFFWVVFAFTGALLVFAFFVVEETYYIRSPPSTRGSEKSPGPTTSGEQLDKEDSEDKKSDNVEASEHLESQDPSTTEPVPIPARKTWLQQLRIFGVLDRDVSFVMMNLRAFSYLLVPHVFWVIATYGLFIGLGALTFNYTFSTIIIAPPYNWSVVKAGLIAVSTIVGFGLAAIFAPLSDRLAARSTKKNGGIREAEMRLPILFPSMIIAPCGLIVYGMTAEKQLHWFGYFAGVFMDQFGSYFYFTNVLAYAIDSYASNTAEMLIIMNLGKQGISFGMGFRLLTWVISDGYATVIAGIFTGVLFMNTLAVIPFYLWGKPIRRWMSKQWLARMHRMSIKGEKMVH